MTAKGTIAGKNTCTPKSAEIPPPPISNQTRPKRQVISVTDAAVNRIKTLLDQRHKQGLGIRIGVKSSGCTGLGYTFEYADEVKPSDECVEEKGINVYIDSKAVLYLIGTKLDYVEDELQSGFIFLNPNAKGQCGCGESFYV